MHPLTREKQILKETADRIIDLKIKIRCHWDYPEFMPVKEMAIKNRSLSQLKRAYRHRHIAYCMVRNGGDYKKVEANCKRPVKWERVTKHRLRLLSAINDYYNEIYYARTKPIRDPAYAEPTKDLAKRSANQNRMKKLFEKLQSIYKEYGIILITTPLAEFVTDVGENIPLQAWDFEETIGGLVYNIKENGIVYYENSKYPVSDGCTINILKSNFKINENGPLFKYKMENIILTNN